MFNLSFQGGSQRLQCLVMNLRRTLNTLRLICHRKFVALDDHGDKEWSLFTFCSIFVPDANVQAEKCPITLRRFMNALQFLFHQSPYSPCPTIAICASCACRCHSRLIVYFREILSNINRSRLHAASLVTP